jgi:hypothetical protein
VRAAAITATLSLACLLPACGPSATEADFDSANPAARLYAIEDAARRGDRTAIRDIIQQLDCDDPAVRLLAISTLQRLTGETYGYRHYDDPAQRREAIARWVAALDSGAIQPIQSGPPRTSSENGPS